MPADAPRLECVPFEPVTLDQIRCYLLVAKLGEGGMGTVYRAVHTRLQKVVALKMLSTHHLHDSQLIRRFQREMLAVGQLDHPNLVHAFDAGEDGGRHYLVMEYLHGLDLSSLVRQQGPLPVADACEIVRQASNGLEYIHTQGLIHRDIKPSNLFLTVAGQVKIVDLGLARLLNDLPVNERMTATGQVMGTLDYMAPEQAQDAHQIDIRADIYSLGCTLFKLLSNRAMFDADEYLQPWKKIRAHSETPPPMLRDYRSDVPDDLEAVLKRMLAKKPLDRYSRPAAVAEALEPFTRGHDLLRFAVLAPAIERPTGEPGGGTVSAASVGTPNPAAAQTVIERRRPVRRFTFAFLLAGALFACAAAITAAVVLGRNWVEPNANKLASVLPTREPPPPKTNSVSLETPARKNPDHLTPLIWHDLLEFKPRDLLWQNATGQSRRDYDPVRRELWVQSAYQSLFTLGNAAQPGFKFQLGITQNVWVGNVGVFFGYHPMQSEKGEIVTYQIIELRKPIGKPYFTLCRSRATTRRNGTPVETFDACAVPVGMVSGTEQILEIDVGDISLSRVRWAGQDVPELIDSRINCDFKPSDYAGDFGVYVSRSTGVFRNARVMFYNFRKD